MKLPKFLSRKPAAEEPVNQYIPENPGSRTDEQYLDGSVLSDGTLTAEMYLDSGSMWNVLGSVSDNDGSVLASLQEKFPDGLHATDRNKTSVVIGVREARFLAEQGNGEAAAILTGFLERAGKEMNTRYQKTVKEAEIRHPENIRMQALWVRTSFPYFGDSEEVFNAIYAEYMRARDGDTEFIRGVLEKHVEQFGRSVDQTLEEAA